MKVQWLGHSCFVLTAGDGTRIITDPYTPGLFGLGYEPVAERADIVTVSHEHGDHNNIRGVKDAPEVVRGPGPQEAKGIQFIGIDVRHDDVAGTQRGANTIYCFSLDGMRICHLGDLGHVLDQPTLEQIGLVDILFIPVGGNFTIDSVAANRVISQIRPRIVFPMHFRNSRCPGFPVARVEDFTRRRKNVTMLQTSETEISKDALPEQTQTIVLRPAR